MTEPFIPLCIPEFRGREIEYLSDCIETGWVSYAGSYVTKFEQMLAEICRVKHGVATNCGTAALHLALHAVGVRKDDEVIMPTVTFIASANAARYLGAWPALIDSEPQYWQLDITKVAEFLEDQCDQREDGLYNLKTGRRVSAIMPVHILGHPVDMFPLMELAYKFALPVVEDATESLGAKYRGQPVGTHGNCGCLSFNGNKMITSGGGGMIVTNDQNLAKRTRHLSTTAKTDVVEFVHDEVGWNYRLTNLQAAVGCAQLENLDAYLSKKQAIANNYVNGLQNLPGITLPVQAEWATSCWWLYTIAVNEVEFGLSARELLRALELCGIQSRPLWQPMHLSPAQTGAFCSRYPVAERLHETCLSLPSSIGLDEGAQLRVIEAICQLRR